MQSNRLRQVDEAVKKAAARLSATSLHSLMREPARSRFIYQFEDLTVDCTRQLLDDEDSVWTAHRLLSGTEASYRRNLDSNGLRKIAYLSCGYPDKYLKLLH